MSKKPEKHQMDTLEQIKRLLILGLSEQGIQGNRIAETIGVDSATVSRILSPKKLRK